MLLEIQEKLKTLESNLDGNQGTLYHKGLLEMDRKLGQQHYARNSVKRALIFQSMYHFWKYVNTGLRILGDITFSSN